MLQERLRFHGPCTDGVVREGNEARLLLREAEEYPTSDKVEVRAQPETGGRFA
jgi:hypothetical protein